jgi:hypothetical protein
MPQKTETGARKRANTPGDTYALVCQQLAARPGVLQAKMFGMPSLKVNGKAFAGLFQDDMVFKLTADAHMRALALKGAHLFDPSGRDRPMKEWVQVPSKYSDQWLDLAQEAWQYVGKEK